ncbi:MAG: Ig-like domain repeat protein, partial [Terriglobia bacterium]
MVMRKSFSRSFIRPGIVGAAVAFLVLVTWIPAQAQTGGARHAAKRVPAAAQAPASSQAVEGVPATTSRLDLAFIPVREIRADSILPTNGATIPEHVFLPYYYPSSASGFASDTSYATSGVKYFTLAFLQTASGGDPCTVYWQGSTSTPVSATGNYATGIANIRARGGDVVPSFGGSAADTYSGTTGFWELADRCTDVSKIAAEYERVITTLNVTRLDFDTEEDSDSDPAGITRRNQAIALVEQWAAANDRVVQFVYTLPTNVAGLNGVVDGSGYTEGAGILRNAIQNGAVIAEVDIMTFDYYDDESYAGGTHNMGADTITTATHLYNTLRVLYPGKTSAQLWDMIGFCEMPGVDDFGSVETYSLANAQTDMPWAVANGVASIAFWDYQRDTANRGGTGTAAYSYSKIFEPITGWGASAGLTSSVNPSTAGQAVTFSTSVSAIDAGLPTPTGTVQFVVDGSNSGSPVALDGSGNATSAPISNLSTANHIITATYGGDSVFGATSATLTQSVGVPIPAVPTIALTSSQNPVPFGPQVTFTATVTGTAGTPTGTVQFLLDDVDLTPCTPPLGCEGANGPIALDRNGMANSGPIDDSPHVWPASGPHRVAAIYSGDANYQSGVSGTLIQTVDNCGNCPTVVTVASTTNPSYPGQAATFTWTVSPTQAGSPTGSVQIVADGTNVLGTWPSLYFNEGTVQIQSSTLSLGSHSIVAVYSGDADFSLNTSAPLTQVVSAPVTVTVTTLPTGRSFSVDGGRAATKATNYTWAQGGNHTLAINSTTQAGTAGTQY